MKKLLIALMVVLMASPCFGFGGRGVDSSGSGSGVQTASECNAAAYYPIGTLCQDTDDGKLYKGTGAAVAEITAGTGIAADGSVPWTGAPVPNAANTIALGSATAEWADIFLGDGAIIYGQNNQTNTLTSAATGWSAALLMTFNAGIAVKQGSTGAGFIDIYEDSDDGTNKVRLLAQAMSGDYSWTFPAAVAATNGAAFVGNTDGTTLFTVNPSFSTLNLVATNSLNLGTAGSAVGQITLKNATSGGITVQPITGALGSASLVLGTTYTDAKWCSYATATGLTCAQDAPAGSGDVTGVGDCSGGACLDGSSDGGTYIALYDGNSHKTSLYAGDSSADLSFYLPTTAGAVGGIPYYSGANQLANLAAGTDGYVLKAKGAAPPEWTNSLSISSVSSGGIVLGDTTPDADGEIGYASNAYLWFANSEDFKITASANLWTFDSNTSATFAFTPNVLIHETAGLSIGATGVKITSDNDGAITFTGQSAGYDEDLTINLDDTENTAVFSSSTGVTKFDFSALNLVTTGFIQGGINISSDADGMDAAAMTSAGMYGTLFIATGAGTWILPRAALGMSACLMDSGTAHDLILDVTSGSTIRLKGTEQADGVGITNASGSTTGDFICVVAVATDKWSTMGMQGTWASQ